MSNQHPKNRHNTRGVAAFFCDWRYAGALLLLIVILTYANTLRNEFTYDDIPYIKENVNIRTLKNLPKIFSEPYPPHMPELGLYRPIVELSYMIDYTLGVRHSEFESLGFSVEIDELPFHLTNILIHFLVTGLVYVIVRKLFPATTALPLLSAAVFAVHPVHVEVVASVVGRAESLATLFYLLSFYFVVISPVDAPYFSGKRIASYFLFLLALLSKEMAITLPVLLVVYLLLFRREELTREKSSHSSFIYIILFLLPYAMIFIAYLTARVNVVKAVGIARSSTYLGQHEDLNPAASMLVVFLGYVKLMILPDVLHIDYNFPLPIIDRVRIPAPTSILSPMPLVGLFLLIVSIASGVLLFVKGRKIAFPILWFLITLFPVSNIIPFGDIMAERFLYLPSIGFCILTGWVFSYFMKFINVPAGKLRPAKILSSKSIAALVIFCIITGAMMYRSIRRNFEWRNSITLWKSVERIDPDNDSLYYAIAHAYQELRKYYLEYGNVYRQVGRTRRAREYLDLAEKYENLSIQYYYKSIEENPKHYESYHNLALILMDAKNPDLEEAARLLKFLVDSALPDNWKHVHLFNYALATVYIRTNQWEKAIVYLKRAVRFNEHEMDYFNNLGAAYASLGKYDNAEKYWRYVLAKEPFNEGAEKNLKKLLAMKRQGDTALKPSEQKFEFSTQTEPVSKK